MDSPSDILEDLSIEDMVELKKIYKNVKEAYYVYTLIDMAIKWRLSGEEKLRITSPNNAWRHDGSIVVFLNIKLQWIFPYSFDKTYANIREGLMKTGRIQPKCLFPNIHENYADIILDVIKNLGRQILMTFENNLYAINIEEAATFEVNYPPDTYVDKLNSTHVDQINDSWYHKYEDSDKDVRMFIENNGGYGLYRRGSDELVAWVLQGPLGHINLLETAEKYRGNGYGKIIVQTIAKCIAQSGHTPVATVRVDNEVSNNLFRKVGFQTKGRSFFFVN